MKKLALALLGLFVATAQAEETKYTLTMSGVTWGGCKTYVRGALEKTFNASNIVITAGDKPKFQSVTFTAKDKTITRSEADKAMGAKKERFKVWRVRKVKEEKKKSSPLDELDKKLRAKGQWHLLLLKNHRQTQV